MADIKDPLKVLECIVGKPVQGIGGVRRHEEERVLERLAESLDDIDFHGLGLHEFLQDDGTQEGAGDLSAFDKTAQTAEECEYVCSHDSTSVPILIWYKMKGTKTSSKTCTDQS